jgi:hypothetical protein
MDDVHAKTQAADPRDPLPETVLHAIRDAMRGLQFGSVTLVVQDGLIIQVDRLEKNRLRRNRS